MPRLHRLRCVSALFTSSLALGVRGGSLRLALLAVAPFFTRFPEFLERFGIIFYKLAEILATKGARMSGKLEKLEAKAKQLKEQIKREKSKESQQQRKIDTRKKILVGAMVLEWINQGKFSEEKLLAGLDVFLSRDQDRAVFGLPPRTAAGDTEPSPPKSSAKPAAPNTTNAAITQQIGSPAPPLPAPRTRLVERQEQAELEKEFF